MWYTVLSSHNTVGSPCYKDYTRQVQDLSLGSHYILWLRNNTLQDKLNILVSDTQIDLKKRWYIVKIQISIAKK